MAKNEQTLKTELEIVQQDSPEVDIDLSADVINQLDKPKRKRSKKKETNIENNQSTDDSEKTSFIQKVKNFIHDERVHKISGLFVMLFSIYTLIALISYFFTWKNDQDIVQEFSWRVLFSSEVGVQNLLGRLGAFLSHNLVYNTFGVVSFLLCFVLFSFGLNTILKRRIFNLSRIIKNSMVTMVVTSVVMAYIFQKSDFSFGGAFGNMLDNYLLNFIGNIGTGALLLITIISVAVWIFNIDFNSLVPKKEIETVSDNSTFKNIEPVSIKKKSEEEFITPVHNSTITSSINNDPIQVVNVIPDTIEEKITDSKEDEFDIVTKKNKKEVVAEDLSLDIIETPEEEINEEPVIGSIGTEYDPTLDLAGYQFPHLDLMNQYGTEKIKIDPEELERNKDQIVQTLQNYNIDIQKIKATVGPTVTLYEIVPAPGVRISKIKNLEDDIALSLAALGIRIIAPIPGKGTIGIEVPNVNKEVVSMRTLLASDKFNNAAMELPVALGKTISNEIFVADLAKMPHLLVAGATGQGKSVGINALLVSLLYKKHPSQLKFVLIDPKKVEMSLYSKIEKHFLAKLPGEADPIIVDTKKVIHTLKALCVEMDKRYDLLKDAGVRNIREYNEKFLGRRLNPQNGHAFLPYIVLVIDEFADLIMTAGKEVETPIARLAQLARAIGIHLIIATQRPSVNIITGTIKANFPARIAFRVQSKIDSRTILDQGGADQLIGRGDMLLSVNGDTIRIQCGFVDTPEVDKIVDFIADQKGYPEAFLLPEVADEEGEGTDSNFDMGDRDEFFDEAAQLIVNSQQGSTSLIQRKLKLGYNRAGRLMDQLEAAGIVGPSRGSKPREVLIKDSLQLDDMLKL
jgi:S-DNA-T family DNA segregation ATPase FtsK/SpoIIIE